MSCHIKYVIAFIIGTKSVHFRLSNDLEWAVIQENLRTTRNLEQKWKKVDQQYIQCFVICAHLQKSQRIAILCSTVYHLQKKNTRAHENSPYWVLWEQQSVFPQCLASRGPLFLPFREHISGAEPQISGVVWEKLEQCQLQAASHAQLRWHGLKCALHRSGGKADWWELKKLQLLVCFSE